MGHHCPLHGNDNCQQTIILVRNDKNKSLIPIVTENSNVAQALFVAARKWQNFRFHKYSNWDFDTTVCQSVANVIEDVDDSYMFDPVSPKTFMKMLAVETLGDGCFKVFETPICDEDESVTVQDIENFVTGSSNKRDHILQWIFEECCETKYTTGAVMRGLHCLKLMLIFFRDDDVFEWLNTSPLSPLNFAGKRKQCRDLMWTKDLFPSMPRSDATHALVESRESKHIAHPLRGNVSERNLQRILAKEPSTDFDYSIVPIEVARANIERCEASDVRNPPSRRGWLAFIHWEEDAEWKWGNECSLTAFALRYVGIIREDWCLNSKRDLPFPSTLADLEMFDDWERELLKSKLDLE